MSITAQALAKAAQALYMHPIKASRDPVIDAAVNAMDEAIDRLQTLEEACSDALNVLIGCCVPAGGVDDQTTILETQKWLRQVLADAEHDYEAAS